MNYQINADNYQKFTDFLYAKADLKYRAFTKSLIPGENRIIGIRIPILKEIAQNLVKENGSKFLKTIKHDTHEECLIHGLIIGYLKVDFNSILNYLDDFLPYNTNWAINDTTVSNLKIFKSNLDVGLSYIKKLLKKDLWYIRFALVLLLNYYINDDYIDEVIKLSKEVKNSNYYVLMANAWLISCLYIKYPDIIYPLLINNTWDIDTTKKAIQKIKDSYKVSTENKNKLEVYLIKLKEA